MNIAYVSCIIQRQEELSLTTGTYLKYTQYVTAVLTTCQSVRALTEHHECEPLAGCELDVPSVRPGASFLL